MPREQMTAEELLGLEIPGKRTELVRGTLVVREPTGWKHAEVTLRIGAALAAWADQHVLPSGAPAGRVAVGDPGFWIGRAPDTVRAPDVAFVAADRAPTGRVTGFLEVAPTLAVEVVSPNDRWSDVLARVAQWLESGAALVWVVDPERREAHVHRADGSQATVDELGALEGESLLARFSLPMASLLLR